jgi:diguanylate cyclase (GGDEF)-like protein/hemerythrin-like metal-binding protein
MQAFHWDAHFETGIAKVDQQHQALVETVNRLGTLVAEGEVTLQKLEEVMSELTEYASAHFEHEERMMRRVAIDPRHLDAHLGEHMQFFVDTVALHRSVVAKGSSSAGSLLDFLTHWLAYHILGRDQNMARQVKAIEEGKTAEQAYAEEERRQSNSTGPLLAALKGLVEQLTERNRELVELNASLEEKVKERTAELAEANLQLEQLASTDALTKLPNRRHAMYRLELLWQAPLGDEKPLACMMIDADGFKQINDTYGHDAGDVVLETLAQTLKDAVRTDDLVARLGGDEFLIICPHTPRTGALLLAENVRKEVDALRVSAGDGVWNGSISVGVAVREASMSTVAELLKKADEGVYLAKRAGRNCVRCA